jgi:ABC-type transporter Mla subunit MlaD
VHGKPQSVAELDLKLDKTIQPLSGDTKVLIRSRSALGLKYVQLAPGTGGKKLMAGDTIPLKNATLPVEFDDLLNTFDLKTRQSSRQALTGYGDAFAGRGESINEAIQGLNPFFTHLAPVMKNLSNPNTALNKFFKNIGAASAEVAPVAEVQAKLFGEMADTFKAITNCPSCLQQTIEKGPPTEDASIRSFRVQQPFLADFADLSSRLRPTAQLLPTALPKINSALKVGTPVVRQSVTLNNETGKVFNALDDLVQDPNTLLALRDARDTVGVLNPFINYVAPYQTVCNYASYFLTGLQGDVAFQTGAGTAQAGLLKGDGPADQDNKMSSWADRPADVPSNVDVHGKDDAGQALEKQMTQPYGPAIDAQGNADCQSGQTGYISGPLNGPTGGRSDYPPANASPSFYADHAGGSHTVNQMNSPGLSGPTYTGVPNLKDVP